MKVDEKIVIDSVLDQSYGDNDLDNACVKRLEGLAHDYGESGKIAVELLSIVKKLLEIY